MKIVKIRSSELPKGCHYVALIAHAVAVRRKWAHRLEAVPLSCVVTASAGGTHVHLAILHSDADLLGIPVIAHTTLRVD